MNQNSDKKEVPSEDAEELLHNQHFKRTATPNSKYFNNDYNYKAD